MDSGLTRSIGRKLAVYGWILCGETDKEIGFSLNECVMAIFAVFVFIEIRDQSYHRSMQYIVCFQVSLSLDDEDANTLSRQILFRKLWIRDGQIIRSTHYNIEIVCQSATHPGNADGRRQQPPLL